MDNFFRYLTPKKTPTEVTKLPGGRVSVPTISQSFIAIKGTVDFIKPGFEYEYIPVIRKLLRVNSSVSLAVTNIVELANTGFDLKFDSGVSAEQALKMKDHIDLVSKNWGSGIAGLHGIINKLIAQIYVGGALSGEWVVKRDLTGIHNLAFVNAETVRVHYNKGKQAYDYYQVPFKASGIITPISVDTLKDYIKLNPATFHYYALMGDEDSPVGIPPLMSALDDIYAQLKMLKNIGYVSDQLGLLGFMEILSRKPDKREGETIPQYLTRTEKLLTDTKNSVKDGLKDGIIAGFEGDHEFEFHSTTKDMGGVYDIFSITQSMVSNGLFASDAFMNGGNGGSETAITVVFTKMLSQLHNVQTMVSQFLIEGITLELRMMGFTFDKVNLEFKASTITDELKKEQAQEIRVRNHRTLYADGIIGMEQFAVGTGYEKADQKEPRVEIDPNKIASDEVARKKKETDKDTGDRSTRDKKKAQPKRKDQDSRKR